MSSYKLAVLISGSGSNLQAIIDAIEEGTLKASIDIVIADNPNSYGLERARKCGINTKIIKKNTLELLSTLQDKKVDLVVLAGYLSILEEPIIAHYPERIINIHPSLLPKYSGKSFYGLRVHQAVIDAQETVSGATVHFVDQGIDTGSIILQQQVPVLPSDTAEILQNRVLEAEHQLLVRAIEQQIEQQGRIR